MDIDCVLDCRAELGEGPVWDALRNVLYWVNIKAQEIHRFDPASGTDCQWPTPADVGSLALCPDGGLIAALKTGFFSVDPSHTRFVVIAEPEIHLARNRFNDGKTDRQGRFWAGTLDDQGEREPTGALYRLDPDRTCHKVVEGIYASNGLAFSPDGTTAYYACSRRRIVWKWDVDRADGTLSHRAIFLELDGRDGVPDGAAVDCTGCYWLAQPPAARIVRYDPAGRADRVIVMPVSQPTCVAFGGSRMDTLYVTTARYRMPREKLRAEPLAGSLFAVRPGVCGLPDTYFGG